MQQSSVSPLTSTELLKQLHWFPIEWRIRFKLACLVHKILNTGHPPYVTELLQYHKPARSTPVTYFLFRDTTFHLVLALSASLRPKYGTPYLFTSANPKHTLPSDVILRRTTLFQPMSPPYGPCNASWFSSETLALYKSLTYLLTERGAINWTVLWISRPSFHHSLPSLFTPQFPFLSPPFSEIQLRVCESARPI